jgi:zinc transporter 13
VSSGVVSNGEVKVAEHSQTVSNHYIKTSGWLNLMANIIDNFTHGLAVAGSFNVSLKTGLITTFAILLHEVPHEIGDFAILLRAGFDRWKAAKAQLLTATGGILGAVAALSAESTEQAGDRTAWILPFTSGGFLYIALVTVLPDLLHDHSNPWQTVKQFLLLCTGIAIMASITVFVD